MVEARYRIAVLAFICACSSTETSSRGDGSSMPEVDSDLGMTSESDVAGVSQCTDVAWRGNQIRGGAAIWNGSLFVLWADTLVVKPDAGPAYDPAAKEHVLAESRIDAGSGMPSTLKRRVFPLGTNYDLSVIPAAGIHAGQFLAATRDGDAFALATGSLGNPGFSNVPFHRPSDLAIGTADFIAWDGDAFNIELDSSDRSTWVGRCNPDGSVKQPPTKYGLMLDSSFEGYEPGYKFSTNAVSGVTFAFSAPNGRSITGHTRDGKTVPWIPTNSLLDLPLYSGNGINPDGGAANPAVSADDEGGVWIAWSQSTNREYQTAGVQHIAADGTLGPTTWFNGPPEDPYGTVAQSLLARSARRALLIASSGNALYVYDVVGDSVSPPRRLTEQQPAGNSGIVIYREMQIISDGTTDWLVMDQNTQRTMAVRVLKIAPGCVYPTHPAELLTL